MQESRSRGLTYLQAAELVLRQTDRSLNTREIVREIQQRQLADIAGETPWNTVGGRISEEISNNGEASVFMRTGRGLYTLRAKQLDDEEYIPPERTPSSSRSQVLVFPSELLNEIGHFHGVRQDYQIHAERLLNPTTSFFMSRVDVEDTEKYKQIVSYIVIRHRNQLLRFVRGKITSVYKYLYGEYSIGFGGHVESTDWQLWSQKDAGFSQSILRELWEEVGIDLENFADSEYELRPIGVLNDDSSPLGRRHFAFVYLLDMKTPLFRKGVEFDKGEKSINELALVDISSLSDDFPGYEYWSKLIIQAFFGDELQTSCHILSTSQFQLAERDEIILVVGYPGSGKTEACQLLADEFGYTLVPCSRIMQELIGCPPIEDIGRYQMQQEGLKLVSSKGGHERLAGSIFQCMAKSGGDKFVLDGLRYPETLEALVARLQMPITTIYTEATIDNLYRYYQTRDGRNCSMQEYIGIIGHPVERAIESFVHQADLMIYNHGTKESYINALRKFFQRELASNG